MEDKKENTKYQKTIEKLEIFINWRDKNNKRISREL